MSKGYFLLLIAIGGLLGAAVGSLFLDGGGSCTGEPGCSLQTEIAPFLSTIALGLAAALLVGGKLLRRSEAREHNAGAAPPAARSKKGRPEGRRLSAVLSGFASGPGGVAGGGWAIHDGLIGGHSRSGQGSPQRERDVSDYPRPRSGPALGSRGKPTPKPRRAS